MKDLELARRQKLMSELLRVTEEERQAILRHYDKTEEDFAKDMEALRVWADKEFDLPDGLISDNKLRVCLLNGKMSLQRAKQTLSGYLRVRTLYQHFFDMFTPYSEAFEKARSYGTVAVMKNLTPSLSRVMISQYRDPNGEAPNAFYYFILPVMAAELRIDHDFFMDNIIVCDFQQYTIKNMLKYNPHVTGQLVNILTSLNLRIKEVHILNCPPLIDTVWVFMKNWLPAKIMDRVKIHKNYELLRESIPAKCLPSDFGGEDKSIQEINDTWCDTMITCEQYYNTLKKSKLEEFRKENDNDSNKFGLGLEGSFRKLSID